MVQKNTATKTQESRQKRYQMFVTDSWKGHDTSKLDFDVNEVQLKVGDVVIPDKKALFRVNDEGMPVYLATVSNNYPVIKHSSIVHKIEDGMNFKNTDVETILSKDGSLMTRMYTINDLSVNVRGNDEISPRIRIVNSYDGSSTVGFYIDAVRLVCTNGMVAIKQFMSMSYKHFGNTFDIDEFSRGAVELMNGFESYSHNWIKWVHDPVTTTRAKLLLNYVPKRVAKMVEYRMDNNFDNTKWGYYNAFTEALTHDYKGSRAINAEVKKIDIGSNVTKMFANKWYWDTDEKDIMYDLRQKKLIKS